MNGIANANLVEFRYTILYMSLIYILLSIMFFIIVQCSLQQEVVLGQVSSVSHSLLGLLLTSRFMQIYLLMNKFFVICSPTNGRAEASVDQSVRMEVSLIAQTVSSDRQFLQFLFSLGYFLCNNKLSFLKFKVLLHCRGSRSHSMFYRIMKLQRKLFWHNLFLQPIKSSLSLSLEL